MSEPPATLDPTKKPAGAMTMVYQDHYFLKRWVDYYGRQFGREHLYVLSHGGDPEHDRIAEGANVILVPFLDPYEVTAVRTEFAPALARFGFAEDMSGEPNGTIYLRRE